MGNEIEAQFLNINKDEIRQKLKSINANLIKPEVLMKRVIFDVGPHSYARIRDEGDKITMTYKNVEDGNSILGTKEANITIDNFENAISILKGCGLKMTAKQETLREVWNYDDVEICIDTWPWLPTFIEIEGPSAEKVWDVANKLGFKKERAKFGSTDTTYQYYYGVDTDTVNLHCPEISFEIDPPEWVKKIDPKIY